MYDSFIKWYDCKSLELKKKMFGHAMVLGVSTTALRR